MVAVVAVVVAVVGLVEKGAVVALQIAPVCCGYLERHLRRLLGGAFHHVGLVHDYPPPLQGRERGGYYPVPSREHASQGGR